MNNSKKAQKRISTILTREFLYDQYIIKNKKISEIMQEFKIGYGTINRNLKRYGLTRSKSEALKGIKRNPAQRKINSLAQIGKKLSKETKEKIRIGHIKYGKKKTKEGYIQIYLPEHPNAKNRYIQEHRLVMEKHLGRYLKPEEVVHHIDFNKSNNHIDNLMLFKTNKEHMKFHTKIRQFGMTNPIKRQIENRWKDLKDLEML